MIGLFSVFVANGAKRHEPLFDRLILDYFDGSTLACFRLNLFNTVRSFLWFCWGLGRSLNLFFVLSVELSL